MPISSCSLAVNPWQELGSVCSVAISCGNEYIPSEPSLPSLSSSSQMSCGVALWPSWWPSLLRTGLSVSGCFFHSKLHPSPPTHSLDLKNLSIRWNRKIYFFHAKFTEHQPGVASPEMFDLSALMCNFWYFCTCWKMVTDHICEYSLNIRTCEYYAKITWSLKGNSQKVWMDVACFQISSMSTWPPFQNGLWCFRIAIGRWLLSPFEKRVFHTLCWETILF